MQPRRVNRKQLFVETLNHKEGIQEPVTEKAAQFITGLRVDMNPWAKRNKPPGAGVWVLLHDPCVLEVGTVCLCVLGCCWGQHTPQLLLRLQLEKGTTHRQHITHPLLYQKTPNKPCDRNWTHKSSRISEQV